uniref:Uncharacterized protein TCIL3000_5_5040 n=1 Tax=Trypanosoma congolense (strain IL3000) TaxID=1068625 RepID=G0UM78_TRYCI|nr:unnamed protein product [Trypanosoma congolense IL3000]
MGKRKEKIPPPGTSKDPTTNFYSRKKWRTVLLANVLELQGKELVPRGMQIIGNALTKNRHVVRLELAHNHIGDVGAIALADLLRRNETIQHVNLAQNDITDVGGIALASAFIPNVSPNGQAGQWNRTLFTLVLSANELGDATLLALSKAAACHRDLMRVDLSFNKIGPLGTKCLMRAMQRNPNCGYDLMGNQIGDEGTEYLCEAMKRFAGKSTTGLNLFRNDVRYRGCRAVGHLIENNEFIHNLSLHSNTLGLRGVQELRHHLTRAPNCLRSLNLSNCMLGDSGAAEIAAIIESDMPTLERLSVADNDMTDAGGVTIVKALMNNTSLITVDCSNNTFGAKTVEATMLLVEKAKVLKQLDFTNSIESGDMRRTLAFASSDADSLTVDVGEMQEDTYESIVQRIGEHMQLILDAEMEKAKSRKGKRKQKNVKGA